MKYLRTMSAMIPSIMKSITEPLYVPGLEQTKEWRKTQSWYKDGKHNECELFQRKQIETMLGVECAKTNMRFNTETCELQNMTRPLDHENGFEWTEDFDGLSIIDNNKFYFNLKFICDAGGAQTRSLREVYHFVKCQLEYLRLHSQDEVSVYFINILDGNTSMKHLSKFKYLIGKSNYNDISNKIFIGDMYTFNEWYEVLKKENV